MFVCASLHKSREENQRDATECFIALMICSTCFGHLYAHHQELETILVLLPRMVCNALVAGGRLLGAEQQAMRPGCGKLCRTISLILDKYPAALHLDCRPPATKALHTVCGNNTSIFLSS